MRFTIKYGLILSAVLFSYSSFSQYTYTSEEPGVPSKRKREFNPTVGAGIGVMSYFGEIKPVNPSSRLGYEFTLSTRLNSYLDLGLSFLTGKLSSDGTYKGASQNFESKITAGGIYLSHNFGHFFKKDSVLHNYGNIYRKKRIINPFMSLGVESFEFNSKGDMKDANGKTYYYWSDGTIRVSPENGNSVSKTERDNVYETDLRDANLDGLGKYSQFSVAVPVGIGVELHFSSRLRMKLGTALHFTFTDMIDNVSSKGTDKREGNFALDRFLMTSFSLHYDLFEYKPPVKPEEFVPADEDGDGIADIDDKCPGTPQYTEVDSTGCPPDDDNDGVPNYADKCPQTPLHAEIDTNGCPLDDDNDGVPNYADKCPQTPLHAEVDSSGCPLQLSETAGDLCYQIQLGLFAEGTNPSPDFIEKILSIPGVESEMTDDGENVYKIGTIFKDREIAEAKKQELIKIGIKDAVIVECIPETKPDIIPNTALVKEVIPKEEYKSFEEQVIFRVQLGAYSSRVSTNVFAGVEDIIIYTDEKGIHKYLVGETSIYEFADDIKEKMIMRGFIDAFVVAFKGGKRVPLNSVTGTGSTDIEEKPIEKIPPPGEIEIVFKVQIRASKTPLFLAPANFYGLEDVEEYVDVGEYKYKYTAGKVSDFGYANSVLKTQMVNAGCKDAFVIAFKNGKKIPLKEAIQLQEK